MEKGAFIFVPKWVKLIALALLLISLMAGVCIAFLAFLYGEKEWVEPGLSIAQFSGYGVAIAIVVLYSERETSVNRLSQRLDDFFSIYLKKSMENIRMPVLGSLHGDFIQVECHHEKGQPRAFYILKYKSYDLLVQVDANLRQIVVMYHFPVSPGADAPAIDEKFVPTINPAKDIGWFFSSMIARERFDNKTYYEIFFRMKMDTSFLLSSADVFFWVTDISVMTRSALLNGIESGVLKPSETASRHSEAS
ncbi:MAG: hypothetical protein IT473_10775 [Lysobacter sp.]|nr:hypothetical protein [Lysobacter sp.]